MPKRIVGDCFIF